MSGQRICESVTWQRKRRLRQSGCCGPELWPSGALTYLVEANLVGEVTEAPAAQHHVVLADQTVVVAAAAAAEKKTRAQTKILTERFVKNTELCTLELRGDADEAAEQQE